MEVKLIVGVCGHRPELSGPWTRLRSAWGTAGTGHYPDGAPGGDSEIPPALCVSGGLHEPRHDISGTCTAGTVQQRWWYLPWLHWKRAWLRNIGSKMSGQVHRLFFPWAPSVNDVNSPKWSSEAIQASQAIVFASVTFGLSAALGPLISLLRLSSWSRILLRLYETK